ncbi:MAG: hypothetical protein HXS54_15875 [Theionarchaea archaeon]|nr:hypothetical protein [Theionarchaea archaeon]
MKVDEIQVKGDEASVDILLERDNKKVVLIYQIEKERKRLACIPGRHIVGAVKVGGEALKEALKESLTEIECQEAEDMAKEALLNDSRFSGYVVAY